MIWLRIAILFVGIWLPDYIFSKENNWAVIINSKVELRTWKLTTKVDEETKPLPGAKISIIQNDKEFYATTSDEYGNFAINIPANGNFLVEVSYPGLNSKRFTVNTNNVPEELQKDEKFRPSFGIGGFILSKPFKGINYSGLITPLLHVVYDSKIKNFINDKIHTKKGLHIAAKIFSEEQALVKSFCNKNKLAYQALKNQNCPLAKTLFKEAINLIKDEPYPVDQLKKAEDCNVEIENTITKKKEAALVRQKADRNSSILVNETNKQNEDIQNKMNLEKDMTENTTQSPNSENDNSKFKNPESERSGITIRKVLQDENDLEMESTNKKVMVRLSLGDDQYKSEITNGDRFFKIKKWVEASFHYENALRLKPGDEYSKSRLETIEANLKSKK